mgnify:CR=1 FL=1
MLSRIYRGGQPVGFWEKGARSLMPGDMIVEVIPGKGSVPDTDD